MPRRSAIAPAIFLAALLLCPATLRAADPIYERTYAVATGQPQTFNDTFAIDLADDCDGRAAYVLRVVTGEGAHGVASGTVVLNGRELLAPSDFSNAARTYELQFAAVTTNALRVTLTGGKPGATLRVVAERRIDDEILQQTYTLAARTGEFEKAFTAPDPAAAYVLVAQRNADAPLPKGASVRVNDVEVVSDADLRGEAIVRRPLTLAAANRLAVSLRGDAGESLAISIRRVGDESLCAANLAVTLDSPQTGDVFHASSIVVRGTAEGPRDLGVAVNGVAAQIDLTHAGTALDPFAWIATVPVSTGAVTLQAIATALSVPQPAEASAAVLVEPPDGRGELRAAPYSGTAPLEVTFLTTVRIIDTVAKVELDLDGDGVYEQTHTTIPTDVTHVYTTPGVREPRMRVTDTTGGVTVTTAAVAVESWPVVDAVIQQRWSTFVGLLEQGRIEDALQLLPGETEREKHRPVLTAIAAELPQVAPTLRTIQPVSVKGDVAHYLLTRTIDGVLRGFHVYFVRGNDGQWKLIQF